MPTKHAPTWPHRTPRVKDDNVAPINVSPIKRARCGILLPVSRTREERPSNEEAQATIADLTEKNTRQETEIERLRTSGGISSEEIRAQIATLQASNAEQKTEIESNVPLDRLPLL